jgi:hypothetical protein
VADSLGARTVAFPVLSSGIFGWPFHDAVRTAVDTIALARTDVREAYLVAHGARALQAVQTALGVSTPLRVLQGLRELYRRGYQQLRLQPGMSPSGAHWRISITTAENLRPGDPTPFDTPRDGTRVLHYSTADRAMVDGREVTAGTTPTEAAAIILDHVGNPDPEPVHPRYTAWFASLIAEVETATSATGQALPVDHAEDVRDRDAWELGRDSGHLHPAPPR